MKALLKSDNLDEYEAILDINGVEIVALVSVCRYKVTSNHIYPVNLDASFLFEPYYQEIEDDQYEIRRLGNGYSYMIKGRLLNEETLDVGKGIIINTDHLFRGHYYFVNKFIELKMDQLCVEFL